MIYVFKTSVNTIKQVKNLEPYINDIVSNKTWNFDLEDCDKILRIDSEEKIVQEIINLLNIHNYSCKELE